MRGHVKGEITGEVTIPGSLLRPFLITASIFYAGYALIMITADWYALKDFGFAPISVITFDLLAFGVLNYLAIQVNAPQAGPIRFGDDGLLVTPRKIFQPWKMANGATRHVDWSELHEPYVNLGMIVIKTGDPRRWLYVSDAQARAILTNPHFPQYGKLPTSVAEKLSIDSP